MRPIKLTLQQARRFILQYQGLLPPYAKSGKTGIMDHIRRVGCIQFDPLNIVGRNSELVLQSRVADFKPEMLSALLYEDRKLVDGWDKMMSIYAVEDWPYFHRYRDAMRQYHGRTDQPVVAVLPQVREEIRQRGPLSSIDIKFDTKVDWSWGPTRMARAAMESMYAWGELIVHHKVNTRKVYDFASNHIAENLLSAPDPFTSVQLYQDWHVHRRLGSIGMMWNRGSNAWLAMRGVKSKERTLAINRLLKEEKVIEITVEHFPHPLYLRSTDKEILESSLVDDFPTPQAAFIAPLDNIMWGRDFIEALFGFRYRWEVYVPAAKREFGYYVLPILYGDRFIGRFEPGWDKKENALIIKQWWWEPDVDVNDHIVNAVKTCVQRFMRFRDAQTLRIMPEATANAGLAWLG